MAEDKNDMTGEKKGNDSSCPQPPSNDSDNMDSFVEECSKEYLDLSKTLDQIDDWMTNIENQSDSLNSKIDELLKSNREIRMELQQEMQDSKIPDSEKSN